MRDVKEAKMKGIEKDLQMHVSLIKDETVKSKMIQKIEEQKQAEQEK